MHPDHISSQSNGNITAGLSSEGWKQETKGVEKMATDFILPRMADQQATHYLPHPHQQPPSHLSHASRYPSHGYHSQQVSPLSTSNNGSPTSPKAYSRQRLRPLFMPAVLRPNEFYSRKGRDQNADDQDGDGQGSAGSSFINLPTFGALGLLSRRSTADSGKWMEGEWNLELFPKPTASPTREHWKPDPDATVCDEPSCLRQFNYWIRRHHCRKCGNIFCDPHSSFDIPLDQDANYNPKGTPSRACSNCYSDFREWRSRTNSQASSEESSDVTNARTAPTKPAITTPTAIKSFGPQPQEVAMSVPRDWNWSTF